MCSEYYICPRTHTASPGHAYCLQRNTVVAHAQCQCYSRQLKITLVMKMCAYIDLWHTYFSFKSFGIIGGKMTEGGIILIGMLISIALIFVSNSRSVSSSSVKTETNSMYKQEDHLVPISPLNSETLMRYEHSSFQQGYLLVYWHYSVTSLLSSASFTEIPT